MRCWSSAITWTIAEELFSFSVVLHHNLCDRYVVNFYGLESPTCVMGDAVLQMYIAYQGYHTKGCRDVVTKASVTVICSHYIFRIVCVLCSVRSFGNCGNNVIQSVSSSRR